MPYSAILYDPKKTLVALLSGKRCVPVGADHVQESNSIEHMLCRVRLLLWPNLVDARRQSLVRARQAS